VVEPIAENLRNITAELPNSDEQFANAVLTVVHQIPYILVGAKYPAETLAENMGDSVGLSLLSSSIMIAGGLDVVLFRYTGTSQSHINVGVCLPTAPVYHALILPPTSFQYNNKTYWVAESTSPSNLRVGDQSPSVANTGVTIIPLKLTQNQSGGQVSASLDAPPIASSISINLIEQPESNQNSERALIINGSTTPSQPNRNITAYIYHKGAVNTLTNVTDNDGKYAIFWNFTGIGTYSVSVALSGDSQYAGAESKQLTVLVGPQLLHQFETTQYNYIFVHVGASNYELQPFIGIDSFLSLHLGTNISLSYDFTVLQTGHEPSNVETKTITLPASERQVRTGHRQTQTQFIPPRTVIVPTNIPPGLEPLSLPDDFNESINNQFCLTLQSNNADNYSLNVQSLSSYGVETLQTDRTNKFTNATADIEQNMWYRFSSTISSEGITTTIEDTNGKLIENKTAPYDPNGANRLVFLLANNVDNAVAFRNLQIQPLDGNPQPTEGPRAIAPQQTSTQANGFPYLVLFILVVVGVLAAIVLYVKRTILPNTEKLTD
jgi:hypothetical protein